MRLSKLVICEVDLSNVTMTDNCDIRALRAQTYIKENFTSNFGWMSAFLNGL
jgi:hypothetical protein